MNTVVNPTREQVVAFCKNMEAQLLAAVDRGSSIEVACGMVTKEVFEPAYGQAPVDLLYVGAEFSAKFRERGF